LYAPAEFGVLTVFMSAVAMVSLCSSLCLEQSIVLEHDDGDAFGLFLVSCLLVACCSGATGFVAALCRFRISPVAVAAAVAAGGLCLPLTAWCTRTRAFRVTTASQLVRVGMVIAGQTAGAWLGAGGRGLIAGYIVGECSAAVLLAAKAFRSRPQGTRVISAATAWTLVRRHRGFPLYTAPQTLFNSLSQGLPAFVLAACFGPQVAGAYWLTVRVLLVPCTLLGSGFRQVYYESVCRSNRAGISLYPALQSATRWLTIGSSVLLLAIVVAAPSAFPLLFGSTWLLAGKYAVLMAPWTAAMLVNLPAVAVLPILGRQRFALGFDVMVLVARMAALGFGALLQSHMATIAAYSGVGLILNISLICIVFGFVRNHRPAEGPSLEMSSAGARYA
jgi:O-antigen/teichoic acid export membrane protein